VRGVPSGIENGLFPLESELAWQREAACPVVGECLNFALTNGCIGVWGGTSERERRRLRSRGRTSALLGSS
jgi:hypothetical protein